MKTKKVLLENGTYDHVYGVYTVLWTELMDISFNQSFAQLLTISMPGFRLNQQLSSACSWHNSQRVLRKTVDLDFFFSAATGFTIGMFNLDERSFYEEN